MSERVYDLEQEVARVKELNASLVREVKRERRTRRFQAAVAAMQAEIVAEGDHSSGYESVAKAAVEYADALLRVLEEK